MPLQGRLNLTQRRLWRVPGTLPPHLSADPRVVVEHGNPRARLRRCARRVQPGWTRAYHHDFIVLIHAGPVVWMIWPSRQTV
jgi:hypothetical protein